MNKAELISAIAESTGESKVAVSNMLAALEEVVTDELRLGAEVTLPGLGKLKPVLRQARTGRNPQTGTPVEIPAHVAIKFKAAKALAEALN